MEINIVLITWFPNPINKPPKPHPQFTTPLDRSKMTASRAWIATAAIALLAAAQCVVPLAEAAGSGPCGKSPLLFAATSLLTCKTAASSATAKVSRDCCKKVSLLPPACLCAVVTSPLAQQAKINPAYAVSIPKRCGFTKAARHAGTKCGSMFLITIASLA